MLQLSFFLGGMGLIQLLHNRLHLQFGRIIPQLVVLVPTLISTVCCSLLSCLSWLFQGYDIYGWLLSNFHTQHIFLVEFRCMSCLILQWEGISELYRSGCIFRTHHRLICADFMVRLFWGVLFCLVWLGFSLINQWCKQSGWLCVIHFWLEREE